jgi:DNA-binding transcriptional LysR family regulator
MSIFVAAVDAGSFSAASRRLNLPLPTVSRKVAQLEASLTTRLLLRTTRKLSLTEAGAAYLLSCKRILEDVRDAERSATGEYSLPRGDVVIAAPIVFGRWHVLPIVCDFLVQYPEINVRLLLSDRNAALIDDQIDIAVRVGSLPDSSLVATRVGSVARVTCGSPNFLAGRPALKSLADLEGVPCVTFESLSSSSTWAFGPLKGSRMQTVGVRERLSVNNAEAAIDAAISGVGLVRVLSYQAAPAIERGQLKLVLRKFEPAPTEVHLVHSGQRLIPLKLRSFLDFAAPRLRGALQSSSHRR